MSHWWGFSEYSTWLDQGCPTNTIVRILDLHDKQLTSIPPEISRLPNVYALYLHRNRLKSIPPEISLLQNLRDLLLDHNQITFIPPEIGRLRNLMRLWISDNQLTCIPREIGQLRNLNVLTLDHNQLISIPPEIGSFSRLEELYLNYNQLTSIPPEIGQLRRLETLLLQNNQLASIPPEIGSLQRLIFLSLNNNRLTSIPSEIGQLYDLMELQLENNLITIFPREIGHLPRLDCLNIDGNPVENVDLIVAHLFGGNALPQNVYNDTQTVHTHNIQQTVQESISRILKEPLAETDIFPLILSDPILTPFTKESLFEYSEDSRNFGVSLPLTFSNVLLGVWNRILISPFSDEIKAVLNMEMKDAECKCFSGRISRLVNCLNGFDDLVQIRISDTDQLGSVILHIKDNLEAAGTYTVERHKEEAEHRFKELNVPIDTIRIWLSYIE